VFNDNLRASPPQKKTNLVRNIRFCTFLPNKCIQEKFLDAVKIDKAKVQVSGLMFVKMIIIRMPLYFFEK